MLLQTVLTYLHKKFKWAHMHFPSTLTVFLCSHVAAEPKELQNHLTLQINSLFFCHILARKFGPQVLKKIYRNNNSQ